MVELSELITIREKEKLVNITDVEGGAFGLVRLRTLYQYDLDLFVNKGIIHTTLDNGQVVTSQPSVTLISCKRYKQKAIPKS